jgi:2-C-methyl-D-erythritol 4-phosphate cytidylyltransferase
VCALIPAAGRGARFGGSENKVFAPLLGRPLLGWTLAAFAHPDCWFVSDIILVGGSSGDDMTRLRKLGDMFGGGKVRAVVEGGAERQSSVREGVAAAMNVGAEWILVHDAARPCVSASVIGDTYISALKHGAATAALPVAETLVRAENNSSTAGENVPREDLWSVQTPQVFSVDVLWAAHQAAARDAVHGTDDAGLVRRLGTRWRSCPARRKTSR